MSKHELSQQLHANRNRSRGSNQRTKSRDVETWQTEDRKGILNMKDHHVLLKTRAAVFYRV